MRFVKTLELGIMLAAAACGVHAQAKPASGTGNNSAPAATSKAAPPQAKPAAQAPPAKSATPAAAPKAAAKPTAQAPAKSGASTGAPKPAASGKAAAPKSATPKKAAKKAASKPAKPATTAKSKPAAEREPKVAKRDPFESLIGGGRGSGGPKEVLPQGKAGLQVSTLRLDGIVRAPNGMIAVVSNPQARTYFLREGDQLYDGRVEKIAMDGVSFHEIGKDAFGKPVERQVNKRIYASAGEQQ